MMHSRTGILFGLYLLLVPFTSSTHNDVWEQWKRTYNKVYNGLTAENAHRTVWENNVAVIHEHNLRHDLGLVSYRMGLNRFTDLTWEEFKRIYLSRKPKQSRRNSVEYKPVDRSTIPDSLDWRTVGAVSRVKDQGNCGSCWAFSAVGALEGQYKLRFNKEAELSVQQLLDCSRPYGNEACNGGDMVAAFDYVHDFWTEPELTYPYEERTKENCAQNETRALMTVTGWYRIMDRNESTLRNIVAIFGPTSVAIDASGGFALYKSGIYKSEACSDMILNHGVLLVGYGKEGDEDFWIVKNSWGEDWGESGYIRMARTGENMCGIATDASLPLVDLY